MSANDLHNIAFLGSSDAGKTSLAEAVAFHFGAISRLGSVSEGTSLCDFTAEEKAKKHSLLAAVVHTESSHGKLNIIDTPGYPDFCADAITAMGAAGTAVITLAAPQNGVPFHAIRLWKMAGAAGLARAVVLTKLDGDNLDLDTIISNVQSALGQRVVPFTMADGVGEAFTSVQVMEKAEGDARTTLVESVVEADDSLMERYLEEGDISDAELEEFMPMAMARGTFAPLFCVDPLRDIGVSEFAEFMVDEFPTATMQLKAMHSVNIEGGTKDERVVARVWKVLVDKHLGQITYLRVLQGTIKPDSLLIDPHTEKSVKLNGIHYIDGKELIKTETGIPGDIIAVTRIDDLEIGDVLVSEGTAEAYHFPLPEPFFSLAVRPASRADEQKIGSELQKLTHEDPTFHYRRDADTHEAIVDGLSDLHVSTLLHRLSDRGVEVETSLPRIPYKETVTTPADGHHRHKKQTGGKGQFAECYIRIRPTGRGTGFDFQDKIVGGSIPRNFIPAVEKGMNEQMMNGIIAGSRVEDVCVELYDGKFHAVDSDEHSFKQAGARALRDAFLKAQPILLEPLMSVEITVPSRYFGDVSGDLNNRRGQILGMEADGDFQVIKANVPLVEMQTYGTPLRSMTHGEGSFTMAFDHYDRVPSHLQEKIVSELGSQDEH
ncbi:MAG: elongation factor G [Planctomycetes bacterium]|jgi:elongation factor G|nr:elongation factor G [Planctomycetota bacterium]MBT4028311.1 elongation factor G [Planctomycetota bacterium]MBT4560896.1 elongation factor G [Planctomycetota bacterium]MBT5119534.1 elongation factor G [Planctomycetota bacterium]MBT7012507.1 elongation factor G [Planctomycetota bacterium]